MWQQLGPPPGSSSPGEVSVFGPGKLLNGKRRKMRDTARFQICSILWKTVYLDAAGSKPKPEPSLIDHENKTLNMRVSFRQHAKTIKVQ